MAFSFGFNSDKQKQSQTQTTSIDSLLRGLQEQNYTNAQGLPQSYTPTSAGQINNYMNPYTSDVINASMDDLNRSRQMALADNKGYENRQGAFTSYDGAALRDNLTNQSFFNQAGLLSSQLRNQGYGQALQTAQDENRYGFAYPLARQGLLNSTLQGITPTVTTTGSGTGKSSGWKFGFDGGGGGGGSSGSGDTTAAVMSALGF